MRKLSSQQGVQAPSSDYLKGRIVNNQTLINEEINGDIVELMHKMVAMAGITENTLPDNESNGHQLLQALQYIVELYSKLTERGGVKTAAVQIGVWDMDAGPSVLVDWTLPANQMIVGIDVMIFPDGSSGEVVRPLLSFYPNSDTDYQINGSINYFDSGQFNLSRRTGGHFDSTSYNDGTQNRGYILVSYMTKPS